MFSIFSDLLPQISVEQVKEALDSEKNIKILDVRTPNEYKDGHIKVCILLPFDEMKDKVAQIFPDKEQKIYIYCRSGARSARATREMKKLGYTNVYNMQGGIMAWQNKGYPISK